MTVTGRGIWTPGPEEGFDFTTDLGVMAESIDLALEEVEDSALEAAQEGVPRRFPSKVSLGGWQASEGAVAYVTSEGALYLRQGGAWRVILHDTGWKAIPLASGYVAHQGTPSYRVLNSILYLKGTLRRTSGNMPTSGQNKISNPIPELVSRGYIPDDYDPAMCVGPTGGTLFRVYINPANELWYGGSSGYGSGSASYMSLAGASGVWVI